MKKIMIAAVAVMLGVAANAAAVSWTVNEVTNSPDATAGAGWALYVLDASSYSAFTALSGDQAAAFAADNSIASGATTAARGKVTATVKGGDFAANETVSAFLVIFDNSSASAANNFAYTTVGETIIAASGADGNLAFGTFDNATAATGGWQSTDVPEPTSGLLLLLGVAGLALKRKRA